VVTAKVFFTLFVVFLYNFASAYQISSKWEKEREDFICDNMNRNTMQQTEDT